MTSGRQSNGLLWLVAIGVFMQMLDTTIVNTALPSMARSLGVSPLRMQSVVIVYALTVAMLIPASGWLADRFGTRRIFFAAIAFFTSGSLACALSQSLDQLIVARIVQGIGGAMLLPVGRLAVLRSYPGSEFLRAMSFVTIPGLVGPLIGPALGGWLVEAASWHWIFLINLPLGIAGCVATWRLMPDLRSAVGGFDLGGYVLLATAMVAVSLGLDAISATNGRISAPILLVLGVASTIGYALHAKRSAHPLFAPRLLDVVSFRVGVIGNLFSRIGSGGMPFLIPLLLQVALGYSPMQAGMMMIPVAAAGIASKRLVVVLIQAWGYRHVLVANTLLVGIAMASFAFVTTEQPVWLRVLQFAAFGAVNSVQFTAMNTIALRDLGPHLASSGNSMLSMVMMLGMGFGVAVAGGLLGVFTDEAAGAAGTQALAAFRWSFVVIGLLTAASAAIFWRLPRDRPGRPPATTPKASARG